MSLTGAMEAIATVAGEHPAIVRAFLKIPATVNEFPSVLVLPDTSEILETSVDGTSWIFSHTVRIWLMVSPMTKGPIARLQDAAEWAPNIMTRINRAFVDQLPIFDPYQSVEARLFDAKILPAVAETVFWGGQITVNIKEHTLYGNDYEG